MVSATIAPGVGQTAQTAPAGTYQQQNRNTVLNQIFQGAGKSFAAAAGQAVVLQGGNTAINVAVTSAAAKAISSIGSGFDLTKGFNIAASSLTSSITGLASASLNQAISKSLASAGPFGPLLTTVATGLANNLVDTLGGLLPGGGGGGNPLAAQGVNYKSFPGAGQNETAADYGGGGSYTLGLNGGDVVFSIRPAGSGAQTTGFALGQYPATGTTLPLDSKTGVDGATSSGGEVANQLKTDSMDEGNIVGGNNAEQDATLKRSLERQDRGAYGKEFRRPLGSPGFRSEGDLF
jgi:hypothetical protein